MLNAGPGGETQVEKDLMPKLMFDQTNEELNMFREENLRK